MKKKFSYLALGVIAFGMFATVPSMTFAQSSGVSVTSTNETATVSTTNDPFADDLFGDTSTVNTTTTTTTTNVDDPFAPTPWTDAGQPLPNTQPTNDPFADTTTTTTTTTTETSVPAVPTTLEGTILSDGTSTTYNVEIPKSIVANPTSKAIVQLQFCLVDTANGNACENVATQALSLKDELANAKISTNIITDANLENAELPMLKYLIKDASGEIVETSKITDPIRFSETTVELGQYDQMRSNLIVQTVAEPAMIEYISKAETGTPFARVIITDNVSGEQTIIPVTYKIPTEKETKEIKEIAKTDKKEVKKAVTGVKENVMVLLLVAMVALFFVYRKTED